MYHSIKVTFCAIALTLTAIPNAAADFGGTQLSLSHMVKPVRPGHQAAGRCVQAIQKHWHRQAKLSLDNRAQLRDTDTEQVLMVGGAVWADGERVRVEHKCTTNKASQQLALQILPTDQLTTASN